MARVKTCTMAGLDVGRTSSKLVVLERRSDGQIEIRHTAVFNHRVEGILSDQELPQPLGDWFKSTGYGQIPVVVGVPQHGAILQLSDFPPGDGRQLEEMVAFETRQLGGLSDDAFLHDHHQLQPFHVYRNPVLIGICREQAVTDRLDWLEPAGLQIADVALDGAALALGAHRLQQRVVTMPRQLDLILDIGGDGSTLILRTEAKIVFVGAVPVGGDGFTAALASINHYSYAEADLEKPLAAIDPDVPGPLLAVAQNLVREILQTVDHWRSQREENDLPLTRIYMTGGSSQLRGLDITIERLMGCRTTLLTMPDDAPNGATLLTAWGLALHGLESAELPMHLSMAPPKLREHRHRLSRLPYLIGAVAVFTIAITAFLGMRAIDLRHEIKSLRTENSSLKICADLAPQVDGARNESRQIEEMLIPFVAFGNRNRDFLTALQTLGPNQQGGDWLAYLADEVSYLAPEVDYAPSITTPAAPHSPSPLMLLGGPAGGEKSGPPHVRTSEITPNRFFIAAGFTPRFKEEPLRNVRRTVEMINTSPDSPFGEISVLPDVESQVWVSIQPWVEQFQMKAFFLMLPQRISDYTPENFR